MNIVRDVYVDRRVTPACEFERLLDARENTGSGLLPMVFVAPSDRPDQECEVAETRVSRAELREWAETILHTLGSS